VTTKRAGIGIERAWLEKGEWICFYYSQWKNQVYEHNKTQKTVTNNGIWRGFRYFDLCNGFLILFPETGGDSKGDEAAGTKKGALCIQIDQRFGKAVPSTLFFDMLQYWAGRREPAFFLYVVSKPPVRRVYSFSTLRFYDRVTEWKGKATG
jgi:hypothetical protein